VSELCEVVITAPDPEWLLALARDLIAERLCASAHSFAPVQSLYWWDGEIVERSEGRVSLNTRAALVPEIVEYVKRSHPYQVPGISSRPITDGNPDYLRWISDETKDVDNAS
jgi:periplasmic divalent cation tolerance protein